MKYHLGNETVTDGSESSKSLQNSQSFVFNYKEKLLKKWSLLGSSEPSEASQNWWKDTCMKITEHKDVREIALPLKPKQLQDLQKNDTYCRDIAKKLHKNVEL